MDSSSRVTYTQEAYFSAMDVNMGGIELVEADAVVPARRAVRLLLASLAVIDNHQVLQVGMAVDSVILLFFLIEERKGGPDWTHRVGAECCVFINVRNLPLDRRWRQGRLLWHWWRSCLPGLQLRKECPHGGLALRRNGDGHGCHCPLRLVDGFIEINHGLVENQVFGHHWAFYAQVPDASAAGQGRVELPVGEAAASQPQRHAVQGKPL